MLRLHCDAKVACTVFGASGASWRRLNPENPDRHNCPEHGQTRDSPACCVGCAVRFRPVHQRVVPIAHDGLLAAWFWAWVSRAGLRFKDTNRSHGWWFHGCLVKTGFLKAIYWMGSEPAVRTSLSALSTSLSALRRT